MAFGGLGHKSYIQLAPEATWAVVPSGQMTARMELINWNVPPDIGVIRDPSMSNRRSRRANYPGGFKVKGTFTVRCGFEGYMELARGILAGYTQSLVSGETVVRDHVMVESTAPKFYQMEVVEGDIPVGKCSRLNGVKFTSVTKKISAVHAGPEGMMTVEVAFVAKDMLSNQTVTTPPNVSSCSTNGTTTLTRAAGNFTTDGVAVGMALTLTGVAGLPTGLTVVTVGSTTLVMSASVPTNTGLTAAFALSFPGNFPVLFHQASTVGWVDDGYLADGSIRVTQAEFTIDAPHDEERNFMGSQFIDEPVPNEFLVARWKFTQELLNMTVYDAARLFTAGSPRLMFQHPTTIGVASKRELEIRSNVANIVDLGKPVTAYGRIFLTTTLEATFDSSDNGCALIRFRNTESALP